MLDLDGRKSETLTDLSAFSGPAQFGETIRGRFSTPPEGLDHAFNANQVACKTWLLDRTYEALGGNFGTVHILGGWYGALGALLFNDARFRTALVISYDIDPACATVAESVNAEAFAQGRFKALTANAAEMDYRPGLGRDPDLIVNTSCEHMPADVDWFARIPQGMSMVVQSNDYYDCGEHVNCVADLNAFKAQVPMREPVYEGTLVRRRYSRFMLIGRK